MYKKFCSRYNTKTRSHPSCCSVQAVEYCKINQCKLHFCLGCFKQHKHVSLPEPTSTTSIVTTTTVAPITAATITELITTTSSNSSGPSQPNKAKRINNKRVTNQLIRQTSLKIKPVYNKMMLDSDNRLSRSLRIFRACRLFNYKFIASQDIITLEQEIVHLNRFKFVS